MKKLLCFIGLLAFTLVSRGAVNDMRVDQTASAGPPITWTPRVIPTESAIGSTLASWRSAVGLGAEDSPAFTAVTLSGITSDRVPYATTGGLITSSANFKFTDGTTTGQLIHPVGAAATPSMTFLGDLDTGLYWISANLLGVTAGGANIGTFGSTGLAIGTAGTGSVTMLQVIDSGTASPRGITDDQYNIGTNSAQFNLRKARGTFAVPTTIVTGDLYGRLLFWGHDGSNFIESGNIRFTSEGTIASTRTPSIFSVWTSTDASPSVLTQRLTINSAGSFLGLGALNAFNVAAGATPFTEFEVDSTLTSSPRGIMTAQFNDGQDGARLHFRKARGTRAAPTTVVTADNLGRLVGTGYDGSNYLEMTSIIFGSEGTVASTRIPTNIQFWTGTNAAPSVLTEAGRINSSQVWIVGGGELGATPAAGALRSPIATQQASTTAGAALSIAGSNAVAGSSNAGAAAGGAVTINGGNAAQLTSGNAAGGSVTLTTGVGIGAGGNSGTASLTLAGSTNNPSATLTSGANGLGNAIGGTLALQSAASSAGGGNIAITVGAASSSQASTITTGAFSVTTGSTTAYTGTATGQASGTISLSTATPANASATGGSTAGASGAASLTTGNGANQTGSNASNTFIGGASGAISLTSGSGGNASGANSNVQTGGASGAITLTTGSGGSATGGSGTRTGGNSGTLTLATGAAGTGASGNGTIGSIILSVGGVATVTASTSGATGMRFNGYGAGAMSTDASGNITSTSDERMKDIDGSFTNGLDAIRGIRPITFHWKESTKLDRTEAYTGFSAQNVAANIPEAVTMNKDGMLSLQDRPIIAALVNAVNELDAAVGKLQAQVVRLGGSPDAAPVAAEIRKVTLEAFISEAKARRDERVKAETDVAATAATAP